MADPFVWTAPPTFLVGRLEAETDLNPILVDDPQWLHYPKWMRLHKTSTQSINNSTDTALTWGSEDADPWALHSTSSNTSRLTVTAPLAGVFSVRAVIEFASNATGFRRVDLRKNGSSTPLCITSAGAVNGASTVVQAESMVQMVSGDYLEVFVQQSSGGALNVSATTEATTYVEAEWFGSLG